MEQTESLELYLHIPFCKRKCRYCDFPSWSGMEHLIHNMTDAILAEAAALPEVIRRQPVDTVFIGGGTPSLLDPEEITRLLSGLRDLLNLSRIMEFTCEANPGTLTRDFLLAVTAQGVNRLSLGVQAYQPDLLRTLGRIHTWKEAADSAALARQCGVTNLNLDLMFGLPGQSRQDWMETMRMALSLGPQHLSCYGLILEEGTPLAGDVSEKRLSLPDPDTERAMYDDTLTYLAAEGYLQYEISNFARTGYSCRHNIGYWRQIPYIGLGVGAASMFRTNLPEQLFCLRTKNPDTPEAYLDMVQQGSWNRRERDEVTLPDGRFETLMLSLRMNEGISEERFFKLHGVSLETCYGQRLRRLEKQGLLCENAGSWKLTRRGMDVQNAVLVELMDD